MVLNPGPPFFAEPRRGQLTVTNQSSHPTGADKAERRQLCQDLKGKAPGVGPVSGYTEGQEPPGFRTLHLQGFGPRPPRCSPSLR